MALKSYYEILGVPENASIDEIRVAFRKAIRAVHPDINPDKAKSTQRTRELNLAMETLEDPEKRRRYDRQLENLRKKGSSGVEGTNAGPEESPSPESSKIVTTLRKREDQASEPSSSRDQAGKSRASHSSTDSHTSRPSQASWDDRRYGGHGSSGRKTFGQLSLNSPVFISAVVTTALVTGILVWIVLPNMLSEDESDAVIADKKPQPSISSPNSSSQKVPKPRGPEPLGEDAPSSVDRVGETTDSRDSLSSIPSVEPSDGVPSLEQPSPAISDDQESRLDQQDPHLAQPKEDERPAMVRPSLPTSRDLRAVAAIEAARKAIQELYSDRRKVAESLEGVARNASLRDLAEELFGLTEDGSSEAERFAILETAVELAIEAGDTDLTEAYIKAFDQRFEVDPSEYRFRAVERWEALILKIADDVELRAKRHRLGAISTRYGEEAEKSRLFDWAVKFYEKAATCYEPDSPDHASVASRAERVKMVGARHQEMLDLELEVGPSVSPADALTLGSYWAFELGEWERGLPYLSRCNVDELRLVAQEDLSTPVDPDDILELADAWSGVASSLSEDIQYQPLSRALEYYETVGAMGGLTGRVATDRMTELVQKLASLPHPEPGRRRRPRAVAPPFDDAVAARIQQDWSVYLGEPVEQENSVGMKFRLIPPGVFITKASAFAEQSLGIPVEDKVVEITLTKPFYVGITEVTQQQYELVMRSNPSNNKGAVLPVEMVSWEEAVSFCQKLSGAPQEKSLGRIYRLPTEAEWEYMCRAGKATDYCFGDHESQLVDYAWFANNSGKSLVDAAKVWSSDRASYDARIREHGCQSHPVGRKKPNPWGIFDVHGNVWEWCFDDYRIFWEGEVIDPVFQRGRGSKVIRGGGWSALGENCRSTSRMSYDANRGATSLGFRVVFTTAAFSDLSENWR